MKYRTDTETWERTGTTRVDIPEQLIATLERTYHENKVGELPIENEEDANEFIRLCRLHAKRQGKTVRCRYENGVLEFRMKDKRPYRWKVLTG